MINDIVFLIIFPYYYLDRDEIQNSHSLKERNELLHNIIDCLVGEYEDASMSDSVLSYPLRHMLIPHMESLLKVITTPSLEENTQNTL